MTSTNTPICTVKALDHIVLTVRSIPETLDFYSRILGMEAQEFSSPKAPNDKRHALSFGEQKINLHQSGAEFEPKALTVQPGSADLCFLADTKVEEILSRLSAEHIEVLEGGKVVDRTGARGQLRSLYVRDPDGNLVEISNYA